MFFYLHLAQVNLASMQLVVDFDIFINSILL